MSGVAYRTQRDVDKYRKEYMANLALEAKNDEMNYKANQMYQRTGAPSQLVDTRDTTEKLRDLETLRNTLRSRLTEIMSGSDANQVASELNDDEARFVAQQINTIIADLKPKFALGVPSQAFNAYLARLMRKFNETQGVDYTLQNIPELGDLQQILQNVRALGFANTGVGQDIIRNIEDIRQAIGELPNAMEAIQTNQNAIVIDTIVREVEDMVRELPSSTQLKTLLGELDVATSRRDTVLAESIMRQIASLTAYAGDLQQELAALRETIKESEQLPFAQVDEIPAAEAGARRIVGEDPKIVIKNIEYGYIPRAELRDTLRNQSSKALPNTNDYIDAIRKINLQAAKQLGLNKNMSRFEAIVILENQDDAIRQLWDSAEPEAEITGKGINTGLNPNKKLISIPKMPRIKGRGLTEPMSRGRFSVDETAGIPFEADYVPFGKHLINRKRLKDGVLMVKRRNGSFIPDLKTKRVSNNLKVVFSKMAGGSIPSFSDLEKLDDDEREYLRFVSHRSSLSGKLDVPSPKKDKNEQLINQFEIIRGQMISGNDSVEMVKKFKKILVEMVDRDLLPKGQVRELLIELARME